MGGMRYNVVGQNRDTGARMQLQFEAESKAAAERKAAQSGMSVHHVTDVTDGRAGGGGGTNPAYRGPVRMRSNALLKLVVLIIVLAVLAYVFRGQIRGFMNR